MSEVDTHAQLATLARQRTRLRTLAALLLALDFCLFTWWALLGHWMRFLVE